MSLFEAQRPTPWVWRIIAANAVVLLLLMTLFPALTPALGFYPSLTSAVSRPWTFLTYMFVHAGVLHLAFNMLMLYFLGRPVEQRMGGRPFILFYLACGLGGAVLSLGLSFMQPYPVVGASGAILGVAVAFAMSWPDAELMVFPIPIPIRARTFVMALIGIDLAFALLAPGDGVAHLAHLGGAMVGYLYFRIQQLSTPVPAPRPRQIQQAVMVQSGRHEAARPPRRRDPERDPVAAEVDRVLDKISAQGIASLTAEERKFLDEVSRRKDQRQH
ncbi:MAG TPA: rhomboid family intramembrane serine protease [Gemmatimonadales bacterium]|nr:rhomboid family intramembrane serine protease [Gemmatimonadales bacterium]